ncbi:MAG: hypothetical protein U0271_04610 [Polyangiaceae bacterium]
MKPRLALAAVVSSGLTLSSLAFAQTPPPKVSDDAGNEAVKAKTDAAQKVDDAKRPVGWSPGIAFGASFNIVDTRNVVGQQDGTTVAMGAAIDAALDYNDGLSEWRNSLKAGAGVSRTPSLNEFVKTNDGLAFESVYLMHPIEMVGPFARFGLATQMFPSLDIRATSADYTVANLDGTTTNYHGRRLYLTDPFQPFTFKESLGVFVQPLNDVHIKLEGRAGVGAQEAIAKGNLAIQDDAATPQIEVKELDDFWQVGGEVVANAWGFFDNEKRVSYVVGVGVLIPFATSDLPADDDRSLPELTVFEANLGLNVKIFDWASITYRLNINRQPLLVDDFQVSNTLLLTIGAAFGSKAPVPPPPPPCECEKKAPEAPPAKPAEPTPAKPAEPTPTPAEPTPTSK